MKDKINKITDTVYNKNVHFLKMSTITLTFLWPSRLDASIKLSVHIIVTQYNVKLVHPDVRLKVYLWLMAFKRFQYFM